MVLDAQYPNATRAKVALLVVDGATTTGTWAQYFETIYDDKLAKQPDGQLGLYISDFLGPAGLPRAFCRPSTAEAAAGISRDPQVILTYERLRNIFLKARSIHQGTYQSGDYGEENTFTLVQDFERERAELERQCAKLERERAELERQCAKLERQHADSEHQRAELERQRAESEHQRAELERQRADEATRRIAALEEQLRLIQ
ncbi:hypothetical protein MFIFM68171_02276 [Madurella fahalii]|uniref:Uncharacterized protein n=1 Tax=Madurella fahalii TaxID=1157608 RepID=A0ABQ0G2S8_9PEZI